MQTLGKFFDEVWNWVVYSSANPNQLSSTVKWVLTFCGTLLTMTLGFGHVQLGTADISNVTDTIVQAIQATVAAVAAIGAVVAALRKIWYTVRGKNLAVNQPQA